MPLFLALWAIGGSLSGCRGDDSAPPGDTDGGSGTGGSGTGGDMTGAGTGGSSVAGSPNTGGGTIGGDDAESDAATGDDAGNTVLPLCVFHTDPPLADGDDGGTDDDAMTPDEASFPDVVTDDVSSSDGGGSGEGGGGSSDAGSTRDGGGARDAAGEAGDGGPTSMISLQTSPFIGRYLADGAGRTLYIYAGDLPGDCNDTPVSNCDSTLATAKCADAWPIFQGVPRTLGPGLTDDAFGTIMRADGLQQATYYGWPLYYYKNDTTPLALGGQNKAKSWWAATVIPAGVVIMKDSSATPQKYIADGSGRTLYSFAQDTKGTATSDPVSACTGSCLNTYKPFQRSTLSVVTSLEPTDFAIFVRADGKGTQVSYKGSPLYRAAADVRAGQMNGVAADWAIILQ